MEVIPHASLAALISQGKLENEVKLVISMFANAISIQARAHREVAHISLNGVGKGTSELIAKLLKDQDYRVEVKAIAGINHMFAVWGKSKEEASVKGDADVAREAKERHKLTQTVVEPKEPEPVRTLNDKGKVADGGGKSPAEKQADKVAKEAARTKKLADMGKAREAAAKSMADKKADQETRALAKKAVVEQPAQQGA